MTRTTALTFALIIPSLILSIGCGKPEEKLAKHSEAMGKIMADNVESPKDGVEKLHSYVRSNLPEMLKLVGEAMVELDEIDDPKERADRAKEMAELLKKTAEGLQESAMKFGAAAMADKETQEYAKKVGENWESTAKALKGAMPMPGMF